MPNESDTTPPDNNRIPADMDATILPGASGASNSSLPSKVPADIDATILPGAVYVVAVLDPGSFCGQCFFLSGDFFAAFLDAFAHLL